MLPNSVIVEFPSNLGLIAPAPGKEPGVKKLPGWLKLHGFYDFIAPGKIYSLDPPAYSTLVDQVSQVRNADAIVQYAKEQSRMLAPLLEDLVFPLVIGGDCSILIGNALALKRTGDYGLFFLDGHTDYLWPELSETRGAAGMDLALVTGKGHQKLTNIDKMAPYVKEENVWAVGNRDFDEKYIKVITHSNINYYDINQLRRVGIKKCINDFLSMIIHKKLDGFWIHFDVDVMDDNIMPAVDTRQPGGFSYDEIEDIFQSLLESYLCAGMEITILDPDLDELGTHTKEFVPRIGQCINKALKKRFSY